ncbi:MAG: hypothetical protein GF353_19115 [Candidatus Lokiarchaeota archaeon]|nr:hypothetical protein [Candidatus Lokiarchaeota archaeon]
MFLNAENKAKKKSKGNSAYKLVKKRPIGLTDLKKRNCFFCGEKVPFWFFYHHNNSLGPEKMLELWQDENIKLICKKCFDELRKANIKKYVTNKLLRERKCWKCKKRLKFWQYSAINIDTSPRKLIEIWQSSHIEILCCNCFDKVKKQAKLSKKLKAADKIKKSLPSKELEALEFIERRLNKKIPVVSHIQYFGTFGFKVKDNKITGLGLSRCDLYAIPEEIKLFKSLEYLGLDSNQFTLLPNWLTELNSLNWLNIYNNKLEDTPHNRQIISRIERKNTKMLVISNLNFSSNDILKNSKKELTNFINLRNFINKKLSSR